MHAALYVPAHVHVRVEWVREESSVAALRLFLCMTDALARELLRLRAADGN